MRQKNETAISFNKLKEITQAIQALKTKGSVQTSDDNANTSEITSQSTPKPNGTARTKNSALKPTKRAFSERQRTRIGDNSQASAKEIKRGR
ncbi:hypothetical protein [Helicobacter pylori]|uniref:hypothetical protein n=1 Tax=Helicobacter pylori TaxID=210 RepID=UPI00165C26FA|nr:hypothetical protein [Helicobacter pylori]